MHTQVSKAVKAETTYNSFKEWKRAPKDKEGNIKAPSNTVPNHWIRNNQMQLAFVDCFLSSKTDSTHKAFPMIAENIRKHNIRGSQKGGQGEEQGKQKSKTQQEIEEIAYNTVLCLIAETGGV